METRWGLDLDMSAVRLMRRDGEDWVEHAVEKIDSPDIEDRLKSLIAAIEDGEAVMLFLPREQILYTTVEVDAAEDPRPRIERAMDGRTPYALEELSIDWEAGDDDVVHIAAIARDTLDEAADFAEVRHLSVAGYSTLFSGADFPRLPRFDGPNLNDAGEAQPEKAVAFTTARVPSRPPDPSVTAASMAASARARFTPTPTAAEISARKSSEPVVAVADTAPVVKVKEPLLPLDPGLPIAAPNAPPRIRTDIAAASVSGHAASLTPPGGSVRIRRRNAPVSTLAVFAVAFLLTVGIAVLVWNFLPMRPSPTAVAPVDTGAAPATIVEDSDAMAPPSEPAGDTALARATEDPTPEKPEAETAGLSDQPPLASEIDITLASPFEDTAPALQASLADTPARLEPGQLADLRQGVLPELDATAPLPRASFAVQTAAPFRGPEPETNDTADAVHLSAFELPAISFDAIALPNSILLLTDDVPEVSIEPLVATTPQADPPAPDVQQAPARSAVEQALADALAGPGGLVPTELARSLTDRAPAPRPRQFVQVIERQQFGGRTRAELAGMRPPPRPDSAQSVAEAAAPEVSDDAVATSLTPRARPEAMAALVAAARVQEEAARVTVAAAAPTPDTSGAVEAALQDDGEPEDRTERPQTVSIPTAASVARTATIENAIRLNRINLVGVYGAPTDRRALVRLSSGRYVKVKVGDRVDGGTVAQITDSELYYRKGNRTLSLSVPQG